MLIISTILHFVVVGAFSIPIKRTPKRFEAISSYSVNLVGGVGSPGGYRAGDLSTGKPAPEKPVPAAKVTKPEPPKKAIPQRKPVLTRKETADVSLSKKKAPPKKETASREELNRLEDRLREIRKRTEYFDVTKEKGPPGVAGAGRSGTGNYGLPGSGDGSARPLDPVSQRYILGIWEKIKSSWGLPGMASSRKDLETVVTIRIRKDGRIVDINMEKRSGNRVYDESILRVLRSVDPLPPIPDSLNTDTMEIGFRFLPGDLS